MLAQSQTCTFLMATLRSPILHSVLAKISMGCADLYQSALVSIQSSPTLLTKKMNNGRQWECYIKAQHLQWLATAEYHKAMDCKESAINKGDLESFGIAVARIRAAEAHVEQSILFAQKCYGDAMFRIEGLDEKKNRFFQVRKELEREYTDRNSVYHDVVVPSCRDLETIIGSVMAKATSVTEQDLSSSSSSSHQQLSLFVGLVPRTARTLLEKFEVESQRMIQVTTELVEQRTTEARNVLASVNLPRSLKGVSLSSSSAGGFPVAIWSKVEKMQQETVIPKLKENLWMLRDTAELTRGLVKELRDGMDRDLQMDHEFRLKYPSFHGTKVTKAQLVVRHDLQHYALLLENAKNGDAVLLKMLETLETEYKFKLLGMSRDEIERLVPHCIKVCIWDEVWCVMLLERSKKTQQKLITLLSLCSFAMS